MDVDVSVVDKISAEICQSHYGKARDMIRQAYKKYGTIFVTTFLEYMDINHIGNHSSYLNELIKLVHPKTLKYGSSLEQFVYIMYFATPDDFIDVFVGINESCFSTIYTHSALSQYTRKYGMTTIIDILDALATLNKDAHLVLVEYGYITLGMYEHFKMNQPRVVDLLRKHQSSFHTDIFIRYIHTNKLTNIALSGSETAIVQFLSSKDKNVRHRMLRRLRKQRPKLYYSVRKVWKAHLVS